MNFLVVGCGSIGKRHVRNLTKLAHDNGGTVYAFDTNREAVDAIVAETNATRLGSLDEVAAQGITASVVALPNHLHVPVAAQLIEQGSNVLIEKPISHTLAGVAELIGLARSRNKVLLTAYNLRFHPNLISARRRIAEGTIGRVLTGRFHFGYNLALWRPHLDYRQNYGARKSEGGGVILDVIHEVDYITWLLGDVVRVAAMAGKRSDLEIDTEDVAAVILELASGAIVQLHLDYVDVAYSRGFRIAGTAGTLEWDMPSMTLRAYDADTRSWQEEKPDFDFNETYVGELKHFISAIERGQDPDDDGSIGKRGLEICMALKQSAEEGRFVSV